MFGTEIGFIVALLSCLTFIILMPSDNKNEDASFAAYLWALNFAIGFFFLLLLVYELLKM